MNLSVSWLNEHTEKLPKYTALGSMELPARASRSASPISSGEVLGSISITLLALVYEIIADHSISRLMMLRKRGEKRRETEDFGVESSGPALSGKRGAKSFLSPFQSLTLACY